MRMFHQIVVVAVVVVVVASDAEVVEVMELFLCRRRDKPCHRGRWTNRPGVPIFSTKFYTNCSKKSDHFTNLKIIISFLKRSNFMKQST